MFGIKGKRWIVCGVALALIVAGVIFVPYVSYDPRLEITAHKLRPIIAKLEAYKQGHGSYPATLRDIGVDDGAVGMRIPSIGYFAETGSNGKDELDFAGSDKSQKIIGYEIYFDTWCGGLFYINTDLNHGWFFNYGVSRVKFEL